MICRAGTTSSRPFFLCAWPAIAAVLLLGTGGIIIHAAAPPDVLLITLDTTRRDAVGCYAGREGLTPNLDRLAQESVRFDDAITPVPQTGPAHASLFTGLNPYRHGVRNNGQRLPEGFPALAEEFRRHGYLTAAFPASKVLDRSAGLDRGFEEYIDDFSTGAERRADAMVEAFMRWLDHRPRGRPFFAWLHLFDPHFPYDPPPAYRGRTDRANYAGEVRFMDAQLGVLMARLKAVGAWKTLVLAVAGDHGEGLGDHGELYHSLFVYQECQAVPLLVKAPRLKGGRTEPAPVTLADLHPTLLALAGLPIPSGVDGVSLLLPTKEGPAVPVGRLRYFESLHGRLKLGWDGLAGVLDGPHKFIFSSRPEAYDLAADPGERRNLYPQGAPWVRRLERAFIRFAGSIQTTPSKAISSPERLKDLTSLGYLAAPAPTRGHGGFLADFKGSTDPRFRASDYRKMERWMNEGHEAEAGERWDEAEAAYRLVLRTESNHLPALRKLAYLLLARDRGLDALPVLERVVERYPSDGASWQNLGILYWHASEPVKARRALEQALPLLQGDSQEAETGLLLAFVCLESGDQACARRLVSTLEPKLGQDPRLRDLMNRLGDLNP